MRSDRASRARASGSALERSRQLQATVAASGRVQWVGSIVGSDMAWLCRGDSGVLEAGQDRREWGWVARAAGPRRSGRRLEFGTGRRRRGPHLPSPPLPASPPPPGRGGSQTRRSPVLFLLLTNHSLFSRRKGGRLGEEGRGDEGQRRPGHYNPPCPLRLPPRPPSLRPPPSSTSPASPSATARTG